MTFITDDLRCADGDVKSCLTHSLTHSHGEQTVVVSLTNGSQHRMGDEHPVYATLEYGHLCPFYL